MLLNRIFSFLLLTIGGSHVIIRYGKFVRFPVSGQTGKTENFILKINFKELKNDQIRRNEKDIRRIWRRR